MFCCISSKIIALLIGKQHPFCKPPCAVWRLEDCVNYLQTTIPPAQYRFCSIWLDLSFLPKTNTFSEESLVLFLEVWGVATSLFPWIAGPLSEGSGRETPSFTKKQGIPRRWMAHHPCDWKLFTDPWISLIFYGTCRENNYDYTIHGSYGVLMV